VLKKDYDSWWGVRKSLSLNAPRKRTSPEALPGGGMNGGGGGGGGGFFWNFPYVIGKEGITPLKGPKRESPFS